MVANRYMVIAQIARSDAEQPLAIGYGSAHELRTSMFTRYGLYVVDCRESATMGELSTLQLIV
jgi:hypothetical protein